MCKMQIGSLLTKFLTIHLGGLRFFLGKCLGGTHCKAFSKVFVWTHDNTVNVLQLKPYNAFGDLIFWQINRGIFFWQLNPRLQLLI